MEVQDELLGADLTEHFVRHGNVSSNQVHLRFPLNIVVNSIRSQDFWFQSEQTSW